MTDTERKMLRHFVSARQEIAFSRLQYSARYQEICERQKRTDADVDDALAKLEKDERIIVRRHYEGDTEKTGCELNEAYLQGLRDCVRILALLGVFGAEAVPQIES